MAQYNDATELPWWQKVIDWILKHTIGPFMGGFGN